MALLGRGFLFTTCSWEEGAGSEAEGVVPLPCGGWPRPFSRGPLFAVYFRALVNFTHSIAYGPQLGDVNSEAFQEVSEAVVDTVSALPPLQRFRSPSGAGATPLLAKAAPCSPVNSASIPPFHRGQPAWLFLPPCPVVSLQQP